MTLIIIKLKWHTVEIQYIYDGHLEHTDTLYEAILSSPVTHDRMEWRIEPPHPSETSFMWKVGRWNRIAGEFIYSVPKPDVEEAKSWACKDAARVVTEMLEKATKK